MYGAAAAGATAHPVLPARRRASSLCPACAVRWARALLSGSCHGAPLSLRAGCVRSPSRRLRPGTRAVRAAPLAAVCRAVLGLRCASQHLLPLPACSSRRSPPEPLCLPTHRVRPFLPAMQCGAGHSRGAGGGAERVCEANQEGNGGGARLSGRHHRCPRAPPGAPHAGLTQGRARQSQATSCWLREATARLARCPFHVFSQCLGFPAAAATVKANQFHSCAFACMHNIPACPLLQTEHGTQAPALPTAAYCCLRCCRRYLVGPHPSLLLPAPSPSTLLAALARMVASSCSTRSS